MTTKRCSKCGQEKDLAAFWRQVGARDGRQSWCKACKMDYQRTPEGKAMVRRAGLRLKFGITAEQYDRALAVQGGGCAICGGECKTGKQLAVDHCHDTGANRGLLCVNCNRALGSLPTIELMQKAIEYLTDPPGREILRRVDVSTTGE